MFERRTFMGLLLSGIAGLASTLLGKKAEAKKMAIKLSQVPAIKAIGGSVTLKLAGKPIMLIRVSETMVRAISAECTHAKCFVGYAKKQKKLACKCHGSMFDLNGKVLSGPAVKSLPLYGAKLDGDRVIIEVK